MSTRQSPTSLYDHLGYWLRTVSNAVSLTFARSLEGVGVTVAEWVFLRALYDDEGIAPSLLAERMGMTKGAISKLAERLLAKDLVTRDASPDDGRAHRIALTPAGRALVPRLAEIADANDAAFFGALAPAERSHLDALLRKVAIARDLTTPPTD